MKRDAAGKVTRLSTSTPDLGGTIASVFASDPELSHSETASYFVVRRRRPELPTRWYQPVAALVFVLANAALCTLTARDDPKRIGFALALIAGISAVYAVSAAVRARRGSRA